MPPASIPTVSRQALKEVTYCINSSTREEMRPANATPDVTRS